VDYTAIKALKLAGKSPELSQLDAAIKAQGVVLGATAVKLATLTGQHAAEHDMPFPVDCQAAHESLDDAMADFDHQGVRLARLIRWRALKAQGLR
jgi:hypothetical protein